MLGIDTERFCQRCQERQWPHVALLSIPVSDLFPSQFFLSKLNHTLLKYERENSHTWASMGTVWFDMYMEKRYKRVTLAELQRSCVEMGETSGRTTITAKLHRSGLGRARRKPLLSERHLKACLEFAKQHLKDSQSVENKILWFDETNIQLFGLNLKPGHCSTPAKYHPNSETWWWQHHAVGVYFSGRDWGTGQQDNDPKHTAKPTQEGLRNNSVNVLEWPRQSPELNPIKHLWRDLKMAVQELERICSEEWQEIPKSMHAKLVTRGCNCCQRCFK